MNAGVGGMLPVAMEPPDVGVFFYAPGFCVTFYTVCDDGWRDRCDSACNLAALAA
jgi:hypothetical protein